MKKQKTDLSDDELRTRIIELAKEYSKRKHTNSGFGATKKTLRGKVFPQIEYAARVFDADEVAAAVSATLDFWLTLGPEGAAMERETGPVSGDKKKAYW